MTKEERDALAKRYVSIAAQNAKQTKQQSRKSDGSAYASSSKKIESAASTGAESEKRKAYKEALKTNNSLDYRTFSEGYESGSEAEAPVSLTEQQRQKQMTDAAWNAQTGAKLNPWMIANANANYAQDQLTKTEEAYDAFLQANQNSSTPPVNLPEAVKLQEKAAGLDSEVAYWENQKTNYKNQTVMQKDMEEFEQWPEEDQKLMERYARGKNLMPLDIAATSAQQKLREKYGLETLNRMEESYSRYRNQENTQKAADLGEKTATGFFGKTGSAVLARGANLIGNTTGALDTAYAYMNDKITGTGRYSGLDPNLAGNLPFAYSGAVDQKISGDLEKKGTLGKVGSVAYQGGMSALDSFTRLAVAGETGSLVLAGMGSFGQTVSNASANGASPEQAIAMGVIDAGLEVVTEKVSLDNLLSKSAAGYQGAMQAVKDAFVQAGVEISEEELSFIGSTMAEAAILRDKSSYNQQIGELVANGKSYENAKKQADRALINEALQTAAVSGFSGGLMSGASSVVNKVTGNAAQPAAKPEAAQNIEPAPVAVRPEMGVEAAQEAQTERAPVGESAAETEQMAQTGEQSQQNTVDDIADSILRAGQEAQTKGEGPTVEEQQEANRQALEETLKEMFGPETQPAVDTATNTKYDNINTSQEGVAAYGTGAENDNGGNGRNAEIDSGNLPSQSAANGSGDVRSGNQGRIPGGDGEGVIHAADSEGLRLTPEYEKSDKTEANHESSVGAAGTEDRDTGVSRTFTNSGLHNANENVREGYRQNLEDDPDAAKYAVKHNADTLRTANERVSTAEKVNAEYDNLMSKDLWDAEDVAVSTLLLDKIMASGDPDTVQKLDALRQKRKNIGTNAGQVSQAFSIQGASMAHAESTATAVDAAIGQLEQMKPEDTTWNQKKSGADFESWKKSVGDEITNIGIAVEMVEEGDTAQMRDIIRQIAKSRKTTAWFGLTNRLSLSSQRILNKLDFDTLKTVARIQIASMGDDYRARSALDIASGLRKQNMLKSLKTTERNLAGNVSVGVLDAMSDSGAGHMADYLLSKVTGKRTVGNDVKYTKEYFTAAVDAMRWASLCVELNIPIETDSEASLAAAMEAPKDGKYIRRTFRANGNVAMRVMYATQKYMSYALEVSDKIFEGGTNAAVRSSLEALKNSNLSDQDVDALSTYAGNRRTFKDATWKDSDGKTHGSALSRKATDILNPMGVVGDALVPYVKVPMNVAQTGIDYTTGVGKGVGEIISIIKDAKAGKEIDVVRQRQAASDFGRGVSGIAMISLATAMAAMGIVKSSEDDDWDKEALAQAEGRSGAQVNWSALERGLNGGSTEWAAGDVITGFDFLEPFNTQLYLGIELAQEDSIKDMLKAYPGATLQSVCKSLLDSPMMTGPSEIVDTVEEFFEDPTAENAVNQLAGLGGDIVSSFIPQYVRQYAQYTDGYHRDTSGDTPAEAALNKVKAAIPGASQSLPMKYSGLGEPQERGGFISTFVDPTGTTRYKPNAITGYLDQLSERTGDVAIYPEYAAPKSIEVNGETVMISGKEMTETYQKTFGENVAALYGALMESEGFRELSDDMQLDALKNAKSYATAMAKAAVSDYDGAPDGTVEELADKIITSQSTSLFTKAFESLTEDWKTGGNGAQAAAELDEAYGVYSKLSDEMKYQIKQDASGRMSAFLTAKQVGIDTGTFADLYKTYYNINGSSEKDTEKANDWARELQLAKERGDITSAQLTALKSEMTIQSGHTVEAEKFDEMTEAGLSSTKADYVTELMDGIKPQAGYSDVRDIQKAETIAGAASLTESEKVATMKLYMSASQDENLDEMLDMGYTVHDYVTAWQLYDREKGDGKKKRTIEAYQKEFGISYAAAKAMYEIYG